MATWIEVADSAVKIGLGAVIGGGFGYFNAKLQHDREARKEYLSSRRAMLKEAVEQCNTFCRNQADYWATLADLVEKREKRERFSDADLNTLSAREQLFRDSFKDVTNIESIFLLLSEDELYREWRAYANVASEFFGQAHLDRADLTSASMDRYRSVFKEQREKLLIGAGEAFRRPG